jgi:glutaredoxin 3
MNTVTMYTKVPCNFCMQAKALLKGLGVTPTEYRIDVDETKRVEMFARIPEGQRTVPQIFIGDDYVGGFAELKTLFDQGLLRERLGIT